MIDLTHKIELASGRYLDLVDPDPRDITLDDVAHGLSMTCRFSGQCRVFYSVAEHAVRVADRLADLRFPLIVQLAGLHHDDSEAFVTDVPRPAKAALPDYKALERRVQLVTLAGLRLADLPCDSPAVHDADTWALAQEAGELMPSRGSNWALGPVWDGEHRGLGMDPHEAKEAWLLTHEHIMILMGRA